jgi:hypothetical protein
LGALYERERRRKRAYYLVVLGEHITGGEAPILRADLPELHPESPYNCGGISRREKEQSGSQI